MIKFSHTPEDTFLEEKYSAIDSVEFICDEDCTYEQLVRAFRRFSHAIGYSPITINEYLGGE